MKTRKLISLLLALMMFLSVVPFYASAADPIALTEENVTVWPTVDKELYYGQKAKYDLTLMGGVVTTDGTENGTIIEGTWEFTDADDYFPVAGTRNSNIRFVPSDSATYTGFEVKNTKNVQYKVNKPLPVLVDENDRPVATEVEPGAKLSTSTLSGGQVKNPYNADEPKALAGLWRWTKTTTVVNESGYYQARMVLANYEVLYMDVWVQIAEVIPEATTITEYPTVDASGLKPNMKISALTLNGGKVVQEGTETEVAGTFSFDQPDNYLVAGDNKIKITFTPDDLTEYKVATGEITVHIASLITLAPTIDASGVAIGQKVSDLVLIGGEATEAGTFSFANPDKTLTVGTNTIQIKFTPAAEGAEYFDTVDLTVTLQYKIRFVDENGNDIIPEVTTTSGAAFSSASTISAALAKYLNASKITNYAYFDMDGNSLDGTPVPVGTHSYQVKVTSKDTNYEPSLLTFILTLEPTYFNATVSYNPYDKELTVKPDNKSVTDEFDIWVDGELVGTTTNQKIKWATDESRDYNITLALKDTNEGIYALENTDITMTISIRREIQRPESSLSFTATGGSDVSNNNYAYKGDVLTLTCSDAAFRTWQLQKDGEAWLPEGLTEEDLKNPTISFTMPDSDIMVYASEENSPVVGTDCDHLCHSNNPIMQLFWKILHFIFRLFGVQQYCDCGIKHYESSLFGF